MRISRGECVLSLKATRAGVRARGIGTLTACLLTASVAGAQVESLPEGLELLASPATSNNPFIFPAGTTADASRLLFDWGFSGRAAIMDVHGFQILALPPEGRPTTSGFAISPDGAFVVGTSDRRQPTLPLDQTYAVLWREGVPTVLPDLASPGSSVATDVSADGRIVVGRSRLSPGNVSWKNAAVRWVDGVLEVLPLPPDAVLSSAELVSDDGSTIVGIVQSADARSTRLVRWRAGLVEVLPPPPSIPFPIPMDLNSDGSMLLVEGNYFGTDAADSPAARFDAGGWTPIEDLPTGRQMPRIGSGSNDGGRHRSRCHRRRSGRLPGARGVYLAQRGIRLDRGDRHAPAERPLDRKLRVPDRCLDDRHGVDQPRRASCALLGQLAGSFGCSPSLGSRLDRALCLRSSRARGCTRAWLGLCFASALDSSHQSRRR
jgi:hypothetical protein